MDHLSHLKGWAKATDRARLRRDRAEQRAISTPARVARTSMDLVQPMATRGGRVEGHLSGRRELMLMVIRPLAPHPCRTWVVANFLQLIRQSVLLFTLQRPCLVTVSSSRFWPKFKHNLRKMMMTEFWTLRANCRCTKSQSIRLSRGAKIASKKRRRIVKNDLFNQLD